MSVLPYIGYKIYLDMQYVADSNTTGINTRTSHLSDPDIKMQINTVKMDFPLCVDSCVVSVHMSVCTLLSLITH